MIGTGPSAAMGGNLGHGGKHGNQYGGNKTLGGKNAKGGPSAADFNRASISHFFLNVNFQGVF